MKDFKKYTIINNEDTKWIVITDKNIEKDSRSYSKIFFRYNSFFKEKQND